MEQLLRNPAELISFNRTLALVEAIQRAELENWMAGKFDKKADPATWLTEQADVVSKVKQRAAVATFRDQIKATLVMVEPMVNTFDAAIERFVPADQRAACREFLKTRLVANLEQGSAQ